jgi:hypothetical protein
VLSAVCRHGHLTDVSKGLAYEDCAVLLDQLLQDQDGSYWAVVGFCPLAACGSVWYADPDPELIALVTRASRKELNEGAKGEEGLPPPALPEVPG